MLGDPARRAAYDRALASAGQPATRIPVRHPPGPSPADGMTPLARAAGPPLRAGPVRVEAAPAPAPRAGSRHEAEARAAVLAALALRYLARDWDQPW